MRNNAFMIVLYAASQQADESIWTETLTYVWWFCGNFGCFGQCNKCNARLLVFFSHFKMSDIVYAFVFAMALTCTHRRRGEIQYRWGVGCVSTLVTGPSGLLPGCTSTWTLPPQRASTSQTRLASLAGPAVTLQPDPMIHSVGEISRYPTHSECTVHVSNRKTESRSLVVTLYRRSKWFEKILTLTRI